MLEKQFNEIIFENNNQIKILDKKYSTIGNLKVINFLLLGIFLWNFFSKSNSILKYLSMILFITLVGLFIYQYILSKKIKYHKEIININNSYLKRLDGTWADFLDKGDEFIDNNHLYSSDLDIVGDKSLFQMINISKTFIGRQIFSNNLLNINELDSNILKDDLTKKQKATEELSKKINFVQQFEYFASKIKDNEKVLDLIKSLKNKEIFIKNKVLKNILKYLPIGTFSFLSLGFIFNISSLKILSLVFIIIQGLICLLGFLKISNFLGDISHYNLSFNKYQPVLKLIKEEKFSSTKLNDLKNILFSKEKSSLDSMKQLNFIIQMLNLKNSSVIYLILNVVFLWNVQCCFLLENWKKKYSDEIENYFNTIGRFESLISFSVLNNILDIKSYLNLNYTKQIVGKNIGHPLINKNIRINNDFDLNNKIIIVSGSNMSGKTTFLRTIGINLILAYNGAVSCTDTFTSPLLTIGTSMRIADDLSQGISTFYAELIKIKKIMEKSKEVNNLLFLIDEIFRGTNSSDRFYGANTVLKTLHNREAIGLLTTHDLELAEIKENRIDNWHFKEDYENDKITFDYKLRQGVSKTTNAKALMKMVGIDV